MSLIVGYSDEDLSTPGNTRAAKVVEANMKEAAKAALDLTTDEGSEGTYWYVYDRVTKTGRFFEQGEFSGS